MYIFHNNTLPQSYNSFFQKITETHCHFTRSAANQNLSPEFALLWEKEI